MIEQKAIFTVSQNHTFSLICMHKFEPPRADRATSDRQISFTVEFLPHFMYIFEFPPITPHYNCPQQYPLSFRIHNFFSSLIRTNFFNIPNRGIFCHCQIGYEQYPTLIKHLANFQDNSSFQISVPEPVPDP